MIRAVFLSLVGLGVLAGCAARREEARLPLRIGLLADSQITSPEGTPEGLYRTVSLDKRIECAIRPPALEHLAPEMLAIALRQFPNETDVILYLGDGANSGGQDEIDRFFAVLNDYRDATGVPIFAVVGNHDYLGAGNTPNPIERFLILNRLRPEEEPPLAGPYNRPLSKYEVVKRISEFNWQSSALPAAAALTYTDNGAALDPNRDHSTGLYLAGHLAYERPGDPTVELFLADTSDYADTVFKPEVRIWDPFVPAWDIYGVQGSISFANRDGPGRAPVAQMRYLQEQALPEVPAFRFIASHFHPDNLDRKRNDIPESWRFELVNFLHGAWETVCGVCFGHRYANRELQTWLSDGRDYWLSAHTHRATMMRPAQGTVHVGGLGGLLTGATFRSVNIGSTTDYRAHIGLIEATGEADPDTSARTRDIDDRVRFREIPLFDAERPSDRRCLNLLVEAVADYGRAHEQIAHPVAYRDAWQFGSSLLGLNKDYQDDAWTVEDTEATRTRLDRFITAFGADHSEFARADVVRALAFVASAYEAGVCNAPDAFELAACPVK